ncbi:hypothetical protein V1502_08125 [Bacillus sp. SCS-153A]|uniref:hypothetical protein n=1 Tax=Rossellomorea sedimentorum TaxID=3115294 RepID=UPI003906C81A
MSDRLEHIREYFSKQEKVKVEVRVFIAETNRGKVHHYFEGRRYGYEFKRGIAWVDRKDLHKFQEKHFIIHEGKEV